MSFHIIKQANMKKIKEIILLAVAILSSTGVEAQENEFEATISSDIVSQYIWRGQDLGSVSLQPSMGISYKGFSLGAWGSVGLSEPSDTKEIDITLNYTYGGFNIGITDYWTNDGPDLKNRYFKYKSHETNHVLEANVGYDFNFASLQWYTNFAGNDGFSNNGKRAYSSYFELGVPFKFGGVDWTATAGAVPFSTDFYDTDGFAITNLSLNASKDIKITDSFSLPISAGTITNPHAQKAYLVFGLTIQP